MVEVENSLHVIIVDTCMYILHCDTSPILIMFETLMADFGLGLDSGQNYVNNEPVE